MRELNDIWNNRLKCANVEVADFRSITTSWNSHIPANALRFRLCPIIAVLILVINWKPQVLLHLQEIKKRFDTSINNQVPGG